VILVNFSYFIGHLYICFGEMSIQVLCPFFKLDSIFITLTLLRQTDAVEDSNSDILGGLGFSSAIKILCDFKYLSRPIWAQFPSRINEGMRSIFLRSLPSYKFLDASERFKC
jgi:hypothetical protein